jgi:Zn-dependent peptidase ImmA (M78 family)
MRKSPRRPISRSNSAADQIYESALSQDVIALDTPERVVEYCRKAGLINGTETNIEELIRKTPGLELEFADTSPNDAYIEKLDEENYRIVINSKHPRNRQRFSMAHEYVHYQMHRPDIEKMPKGERIMHRNDERDRVEYQANRYAGMILMPEDVFREAVNTFSGNIQSIAEAFGVSTLAARFRAKDLEIRGHGL